MLRSTFEGFCCLVSIPGRVLVSVFFFSTWVVDISFLSTACSRGQFSFVLGSAFEGTCCLASIHGTVLVCFIWSFFFSFLLS